MTYEKCVTTVSKTLEERGIDDHEKTAQNMCSIWADENGVEREFGRTTSKEPVRRSFALTVEDNADITLTESDGVSSVQFPVIAITSGPHEYEADGQQQKVYIEDSMLKDSLEKFSELPIYIDHQRTAEDLIGMATEPELIEMDNGKTAVKMLATINSKHDRGQEAMDKVKDGDMTHVSIDWFSNDVDVMGDTFATNIRPTEVSFIDNKSMDPVCKECTIEDGKECELHTDDKKDEDCDTCCDSCHDGHKCENEDGKTEVENMTEEVKETNVKSDAENIVEREFASLRTMLEEAEASKKEIEKQYKDALKQLEKFQEAEEKRAAEEAEQRKLAAVEAIISKELLFGTTPEENKDARVEELSAWDEMKLTGFSEALAAVPEPQADVERSFGKGKAPEGAPVPETDRKFAVKMVNGRITLDKDVLKGIKEN
tara:strand:- start:495 stop:1781 length:1287 start_codon:yes stop_codon:yes gene_type:complete